MSILTLFSVAFSLSTITFVLSQPNTNASYCVGLNVDGSEDDWLTCNTPELTMSMVQIGGSAGSDMLDQALTVRFAHDSTNIYVLAKVEAPYYFNLTAGNGFAHSVSVMWQIGPNATMWDMGGCPLPASVTDPTDCGQVQTACDNSMCTNCNNYLTDIWHMETASPGALPGITYPWRGPNVFPDSSGDFSTLGYDPDGLGQYQPSVQRLFSGDDPTSNSDDEFSSHFCLRGDDGSSSSYLGAFQEAQTLYQNQLRYAWSHTAINSIKYPFGTVGASGNYIYEFSRPLRTKENTDAQFTVGGVAKYAFAFWIPPAEGEEWTDDGHYVAPALFQFGEVSLTSFTSEDGDRPTEDGASACATVNTMLITITALLCCLVMLM